MANFLSGILGGGKTKNPANAAMPILQQIPQTVQPYYQPFIEQGNQASQTLQPQYQRMVNNPQDVYNEFMSSYPGSQRYERRQKQMLDQARNAASAGGFVGTPQDQIAQAEIVDAIMRESEGQYFNDIMGILGFGSQGLENASNRGFGASTGFGDILGNTLGTQAGLAYQGQAEQNRAENDKFNNLLKALLGMGGAALGGPIGGAIGSGMGQLFGGGGVPGEGYGIPGGYSGVNRTNMFGQNTLRI